MNKQIRRVSIAAALVAALVMVSAPASAGKPPKPGGGGGSDPCIGAKDRGFPSFAFVKQANVNGTNTWGFFVTDAEAKCQRLGGSYPYQRSLDLHYDATSGHGLLVHDGDGYGLLAATMDVSFGSDGSPVVVVSPFARLLAVSEIPPLDPALYDSGPMKYVGSAMVSPDGTAILFVGIGTVYGSDNLQWTCPLNLAVPSVDATACRVVDRPANWASWGAREGKIYAIHPASSGSGDAVYRIDLTNGQRDEVFGRGTTLSVVKAALSNNTERLVIHEAPPPSECASMANIVIDADSCANNACNVLNGAGHLGGGDFTWLPDGRVAQQGISISGGGKRCSISGVIEVFEPTDTNGGRTSLTAGYYPEGAG